MFKSIENLEACCDQMAKNLSINEKGVDEVLDMTTALHNQQENQRSQLAQIHSFIEEYYITEEDISILENGDCNETFFEAFSRLKIAE